MPCICPKGPASFTNVLHFASQMVTPVSVDDPSFVSDAVPIPGGHYKLCNCVVTFEADLDSFSTTYISILV